MSFFGLKQIVLSGLRAAGLLAALFAPASALAASSGADAAASIGINSPLFAEESASPSTQFAFRAVQIPDSFGVELHIPLVPFAPDDPAGWMADVSDSSVYESIPSSAFDSSLQDGRLEEMPSDNGAARGDALRPANRSLAIGNMFGDAPFASGTGGPGADAADSTTAMWSAPVDRPGRGVLDRSSATRMLRGIIDVKAENDRSIVFSVLGMGNFVLERAPASGAVRLSELSSGWSGALMPRDELNTNIAGIGTEQRAASAHNDRSALLAGVAWLLDLLWSPLGIIVMTIAALIVMLATIVRSTDFLRSRLAQKRKARQRSRHRRSSSNRSSRRVLPGKP